MHGRAGKRATQLSFGVMQQKSTVIRAKIFMSIMGSNKFASSEGHCTLDNLYQPMPGGGRRRCCCSSNPEVLLTGLSTGLIKAEGNFH